VLDAPRDARLDLELASGRQVPESGDAVADVPEVAPDRHREMAAGAGGCMSSIEARFRLVRNNGGVRCDCVCKCDPVERTRALVAQRIPPGACRPCAAIDMSASLRKEQSRWPAGLFLDVARQIGEDPEDFHVLEIIGAEWDRIQQVLDEIELLAHHTCRSGRPS
jgi:hypothetical protein